MNKSSLWRVFGAIALAMVAGGMTSSTATIFDVNIIDLYGLVGQVFLNALKVIVVPLVSSSIILATARMGENKAFKTLGAKSFGYFLMTTLLAMLVGFFLMTTFQPGQSVESFSKAPAASAAAAAKILPAGDHASAFSQISDLILRMVPSNILSAAAEGQMLGLIVFCSIFGFLVSRINKHDGEIVLSFFHGIFLIMMQLTQIVMKVLPIGVFALIAKVVATTGYESMASVATYFVVVLFGLLACCFIVFPLLLRFVARVDPWNHFKGMLPALLTAFSTSSSAAAMPVTISCLEDNLKVPSRICDFFLPLATAINMPGTALHICASVFFIAQVEGISYSIGVQAVILMMVLLTSFGVAGVPSGSLFAIVTVLSMLGLSTEGVVLILAAERLLDMFRTSLNVYANSCCAVMLAKEPVPEPEQEPVPG